MVYKNVSSIQAPLLVLPHQAETRYKIAKFHTRKYYAKQIKSTNLANRSCNSILTYESHGINWPKINVFGYTPQA
jgi:hypothetical protein